MHARIYTLHRWESSPVHRGIARTSNSHSWPEAQFDLFPIVCGFQGPSPLNLMAGPGEANPSVPPRGPRGVYRGLSSARQQGRTATHRE
jgi:hypothetical protein